MKKETWKEFINSEKKNSYFKNIILFLKRSRDSGAQIFPCNKDIFRAFRITELDDVKVVIIGQDPYHGNNQADGLAFSVRNRMRLTPSLYNIYKEIKTDLDCSDLKENNCLESWARQGVLMLNTILTVERGKPMSHKNIGWEIFTNRVISKINKKNSGVVFLLWGTMAVQKKYLINTTKHFVLETSHPSNYSVNKGFFGCRHFSKTNKILKSQNKSPIVWISK
ncbi:uracil-DNA glycosylase [Candidatus Riesia sp. GBBU]|nr:uracil-DNA glycosylase [Candidatus Riesia sp. GBBU]